MSFNLFGKKKNLKSKLFNEAMSVPASLADAPVRATPITVGDAVASQDSFGDMRLGVDGVARNVATQEDIDDILDELDEDFKTVDVDLRELIHKVDKLQKSVTNVAEIASENHVMLRRLKNSGKRKNVAKIVKTLIIFAVVVGSYWFVYPKIKPMVDMLMQAQQQLQSLNESVGGINDGAANLQDILGGIGESGEGVVSNVSSLGNNEGLEDLVGDIQTPGTDEIFSGQGGLGGLLQNLQSQLSGSGFTPQVEE